MAKHDRYSKEDIYNNCRAVFDLMEEGFTMRKACLELDLKVGNMMRWINSDESIARQYEAARGAMCDAMAMDIVRLSEEKAERYDNKYGTQVDSGFVANKRLEIDTKKWLLSKLASKKYGDRVTHEGSDENPIKTVTEINLNIKGAKDD